MLVRRLKVGESVQVFDPAGKLVGTVKVIVTKQGKIAGGYDFMKDYTLKTQYLSREVKQELEEVPEEASNAY